MGKDIYRIQNLALDFMNNFHTMVKESNRKLANSFSREDIKMAIKV